MIRQKMRSLLRHEIKFVANELEYSRLWHWIICQPACFSVHYPDRKINNIYFDSHCYGAFWESLSGFSSRTKLRYRWYGGSLHPDVGTLEVKNKRNQLVWKTNYELDGLQFGEKIYWKDLCRELLYKAPKEARVHLQENPLPILINRYHRKYFINKEQTIRITLDSQLSVYDQRHKAFPNVNRRAMIPRYVILEVKFSPEHRDQASKILRDIPVNISRNSKYISGVMVLSGQ